MKINFNDLSVPVQIEPYTTAQEKEVLLIENYLDDMNDPKVLDIALDIFKIPEKIIQKLSQDEKKVLLIKFREISIGNEIDIRFKCNKCQFPNEGQIDISKVVNKAKKISNNVRDLHRLPIDVDDVIKNFLIDENICMEKFEDILSNINDYITYYNFVLPVKCLHCKHENHVSIYNNKFLISLLSEDSLTSLYKSYQLLMFHGNWSKLDIDSLLPFERQLFIGLLNKSISERNKAMENQNGSNNRQIR